MAKEFCFFPVVVSKLDSTAEINNELFSDPLFQTTYFQTQHNVGFYMCTVYLMTVDTTGGIFFHC